MLEPISNPWFVSLFEGFEVKCDSTSVKFRTNKTASILALLAVSPGTRHRRDTIASYFWPDSSAERARHSLRMALSDIRSVLGQDALLVDRDWVAANPTLLNSDVFLFDEIISNPKVSQDELLKGIKLVRGGMASSIEGEWVSAEWLRIQESYALAVIQFAKNAKQEDQVQEATLQCKRALSILGCREDLHIALMTLYLSQGLTSHVLTQYEELERELDELWGEPPSQAAIDLLESAPRGKKTITTPSSSSQSRTSHLIGRDAIIESVLSETSNPSHKSITTLLGPGGTGKTSVAKVVEDELTRVGTKVVFIDLSSEHTSEAAIRRIQADLGVPIGDLAEAVSTIGRYFRANKSLMFLDNLEQILPSFAQTLEDLVRKYPEVQIIATSRIPIGIHEEKVIFVEPLEVPSKGQTLDQIRSTDSVLLFQREAVAANSKFKVGPDNATAVIELCKALDGIPLAIELAASRVLRYSPAQILANIHKSLDFLNSDVAKIDSRHQSLVRTLEWSFKLLSIPAQDLCLLLSLINGRVTEATIEAIAGHPVGDALTELAKASLINADPTKEETEFWVFETVRAFCREKLSSEQRFDSDMRRIHDYYAQRADEIGKSEVWAQEKLNLISRDSENYISAFQYGVESRFNPIVTANFLIDLRAFATIRGTNNPLIALAHQIFLWTELPPVLRAQVGDIWVRLANNVGSVEEQQRVIAECEDLAKGDSKVYQEILFRKAVLLKAIGSYDEGVKTLEWILEHVDDNNFEMRANALYNMSLLKCCLAQHDQSLDYTVRALKVARKVDDPNSMVRILFDTASAMANNGQGKEAMPLFDEAIDLCRTIGSRKLEGLTRWQQGDACISLGKPEVALGHLQESIRLVIDAGFDAGLKWIYLKTGEALELCGQPVLSTMILAKAITVRISEQRPLAQYEQDDFDRIEGKLKTTLSESGYDRYWAEGIRSEWADLTESILTTVPAPTTA